MKNLRIVLILSLLVFSFTVYLANAQNYTAESLLITLLADGKASIEYRLSTDAMVNSLSVPLFGSIVEQLTVVDGNNAPATHRLERGSVIIDPSGIASLLITYTTPDLVNKTGRLWTFSINTPINATIRLPKDSVIIGLNQVPDSLKLSDGQPILIMREGLTQISYVIGALGTKEHATVAISEAEKAISDHRNEGIVVSTAENKLSEAKQAFDNGKYADAELLANDAKNIANNAAHNAQLASQALSDAEIAIKESNDLGYEVSDARELFSEAGHEYVNGNYDRAVSLAEQARTIALDARSAPRNSFGSIYMIVGIAVASVAGGVGAAFYVRSRRRIVMEKTVAGTQAELVVKERRIIDINKILTARPYLRDDDKEAINFIAEKGGEAFESEIRERFNLPKTTVWRLVKRLEREELVEVKKAGGQNLIRIRREFTRSDQESQNAT